MKMKTVPRETPRRVPVVPMSLIAHPDFNPRALTNPQQKIRNPNESRTTKDHP